MIKKILLMYATMEGQTEKIARVIRDHLEASGADVTLLNVKNAAEAEKIDLAGFDLLLFGASNHAGKIEKEMAAYINGHADAIRNKPRSFFMVLMSEASTNPDRRAKSLEESLHHLEKQLHVPFDDVEMIAGALMYTKYNWLVKWIMKRISAKEGGSTDTSSDHEYTDWDQVARYAGKLQQVGRQQ